MSPNVAKLHFTSCPMPDRACPRANRRQLKHEVREEHLITAQRLGRRCKPAIRARRARLQRYSATLTAGSGARRRSAQAQISANEHRTCGQCSRAAQAPCCRRAKAHPSRQTRPRRRATEPCQAPGCKARQGHAAALFRRGASSSARASRSAAKRSGTMR
jgi:hypothetical protein